MIEAVGRDMAEADDLRTGPIRSRRLALATRAPLGKPIEAVVDAAREAACFDAHPAIDNRRDFKRAVGAMIA